MQISINHLIHGIFKDLRNLIRITHAMYIAIIYFFAFSCASYVNLPCGNIDAKLTKLVPNKDYRFTLKNGGKITVQVRQVEVDKIVGKVYVLDELNSITLLKENIVDITESGSDEPLIPCNDKNITETIASVLPGNVYHFQLKNGKRMKLRVDHIEDSVIYGKPNEIIDSNGKSIITFPPFDSHNMVIKDDIQNISQRKFSPGKTFLLVFPIALLMAALLEIQPWVGY